MTHYDRQRSGNKLIVVGFFQQLLNVGRRFGLFQESAKGVVAQLSRDILQRAKVIARAIGRRYKQEQQMDLLAVEAIEIDTDIADGNGADQFLDTRVLGVRNGDAAANAGAANDILDRLFLHRYFYLSQKK